MTVATPRPERPLLQAQKLARLFPVRPGFFGQRRYVHAVDSVSLHVHRAETLGVVGESGCGKSTLGRLLLRLLDPTYGRILFDGREITRLSESQLRPLRRRMQIVFQDPYSSLNPRMTVREIVGEGIAIHRLSRGRADADARVEKLLHEVGLRGDMMARYPHEFSGGQRQRIGIARALATGPDLVVCDEPVSALDPSVQAQILNLLDDLQQSHGLAYLLISHDLRVIEHLAHRVAVMYLGRFVEVGPTGPLLAAPRHPYTRALLSAVPALDPARRRLRIVLEGEPPSPLDPPRGCAFHPRCPRAEPGLCDVETPSLEPGDDPERFVACWHPEPAPGAGTGAAPDDAPADRVAQV